MVVAAPAFAAAAQLAQLLSEHALGLGGLLQHDLLEPLRNTLEVACRGALRPAERVHFVADKLNDLV